MRRQVYLLYAFYLGLPLLISPSRIRDIMLERICGDGLPKDLRF